tara:strand:- start:1618 stop:1890 length:273 start_codon:yes stop_codon:yes gene_type:complete
MENIKWKGSGLDEVGYDENTGKELISVSEKYPISDYDNMYYDFKNWLKNIFDFLSLKTYNKTLSMFEKEFKNSNKEHITPLKLSNEHLFT